MKVLFLFGVFARIGGIEEFTRDLALELVSSGIEVEVLCASLGNPLLESLEKAGVKVVRIPVYHGCRWGFPDFALFPFAERTVRGADVVVHQKPFPLGFYRWFSRNPRHVYITAYRPKEQFNNERHRQRFFSCFDLVITQAESFAADLDGKVNTAVLPYIPPQPVPVLERIETDSILRVGMMGRLEPQKKPLQALQLVEHLAGAPPDGFQSVEFHVYGTGSLEQQMREHASSMSTTVVFHGAYTRGEVPRIVQANDLFLITSESEGQCIVALEVLAGGRPLFATPVGALPDILSRPDRGALFYGSDAGAWAEVVADWMSAHKHSAEHIVKNYLEDYDAKAVSAAYIDCFKGLVNQA